MTETNGKAQFMSKDVGSEGGSKSRRTLELLAALATIAGLVVTVLFSVRAERSKALSLRYLSTRPLITPDSVTAPKLQVAYQGRAVAIPYLMSARLENTGSVPIEERDIERPLVLHFQTPNVLGVEVSGRNPDDLAVNASSDSTAVTIGHKLLNPGDWITFDVLFDGRPRLVDATLRVSGVAKLAQLTATEDTVAAYPLLFTLPQPATVLLVLAATITGLGLMVAGFAGVGSAVVAFVRGLKWTPEVVERMNRVFTGEPELRYWAITPPNVFPPTVRQIIGSTVISGDLTLIDDPIRLEHQLELSKDALKELGVSVDAARDLLLEAFRQRVPVAVSQMFYTAFPPPIDVHARDRVAALPFTEKTIAEFILKARAVTGDLGPAAPPPRGWVAVDKDQLQVGALALFLGLAIALVAGGAWRSIVA